MGANYLADDDLSPVVPPALQVTPNNPYIPFELDALNQSIPTRFEQQVAAYPHRTAIKTRQQHVTYAELNRLANRIARAILAQTGPGEEPVIVLLENGAQAIAAILGILKAGKIYAPFDPHYPQTRLVTMHADLQGAFIVTNTANLPLARQLAADDARRLNLDELAAGLPAENLDTPLSSASKAYIIYTSGSTGQPKGIVHTHGNVLCRIRNYTNAFHLNADDRLTMLHSISFSSGTGDMFSALFNGAALYPWDARVDGLAELAGWLIRENVTVFSWAPTPFNHLIETLTGTETFPAMRLLILGSEPVTRKEFGLYKAHFPRTCLFVNRLGASETNNFRLNFLNHNSQLDGDVVPVGYPVPLKEVLLLDETGQPVPPGAEGEIVIRSDYLALGYWRKPELTQTAFRPDPAGSGKRLYFTGDLGRLRPDGCLEYLGRKDFQVKIRGQRIETTEIELALQDMPGIREAAVVARPDPRGDLRLIAYVALKDSASADTGPMRDWLADRLPDYMVPAVFVVLNHLPTTPSGKLDRRALPEPSGADLAQGRAFAPPQSATQQTIAAVWAAVLRRKPVGLHDNFFELGGHSLLAAQVIVRLNDAFRISLPLQTLFNSPTVAGLADAVDELVAQAVPVAPPLRPASRGNRAPLSAAQQEWWFLEQINPGNPTHAPGNTIRLQGSLDVPLLKQAIAGVVRRHEALRTTFELIDSQPVQVIHPEMTIPVQEVDLSSAPAEEREARLESLLEAEVARPFNLAAGPLWRFILVRFDDQEHVLLLVKHHITSDRWSTGIFLNEMAELYWALSRGEPSPLAELPIQYADYAIWQRDYLRGERLESLLAHWTQKLAGAPAELNLPTDAAGDAPRKSAVYRAAMPTGLLARLKAFSRQEGVTPFAVLLAGFKTLLSRYTGQHDILVGVPAANRSHPGIEKLIGVFINTLAVRVDLSDSPSFTELARRVHREAVIAVDNQDLPFDELVRALQPNRDQSGRPPLVQVMFNMFNMEDHLHVVGDVVMENISVELSSDYDLYCTLRNEVDGLILRFIYKENLFTRAAIERMMGHYLRLLETAVANPAQSIAALPLLTDAERQTMLVDWNDTAMDCPAEATIHQLFEEQVARTPKAEAVVFDGESLTYDQLNRRANQVAHALRGMGVGPDGLVGLFVERSIEMVVAVLGVLKAGGAYVPLDPMYPAERLAYMLSDSGAKVLLTQDHLVGALAFAGRTVRLDADWPEIATRPETNPGSLAGPENAAYVIYTSGSTGKPKGVLIEHRSLVNFVTAARARYGFQPTDRVLQFASFSFDAALEEIFPTLTTGGALVLRTDAMLDSMAAFLQTCADWGLTVLDLPTAFWHQLALSLSSDGLSLLPSVRLVIIGGEAAQAEPMRLWLAHAPPSVRLLNTYGPTETTIVATAHNVSGVDASSIGKPIGNTLAYVLDAHLQPAAIGVPGELHIGGAGVARGYLNRPELTAQKFIANPFGPGRIYKTGDLVRWRADGNLDFLGRIDHQVKIRGYRIELGEIETALARHERVREAVVMAQAGPGGDKRLVAWLTADGDAPEALELRAWLKETLPEYMVPAAFVVLDEFPLTPNGKIDRKALPQPSGVDAGSAGYVAPQTETEQKLAAIWQEVLDVPQVGAADNFFELGGHSLLAIQIMVRLGDAFGVELPLRALFEHPTVEGLAEQIDITRWAAGGDDTPSDDLPEETEEFVL